MPWPTYPMIYRVSSAHEEGGERVYAVNTECFLGDDAGNVRALRAHEVEQRFIDGRMTFEKVEGTDFELPCELVLLAMGFVGPQREGLLEQLGVELNERGNVARDARFRTNLDNVFVCRRHGPRSESHRVGDRRRALRARLRSTSSSWARRCSPRRSRPTRCRCAERVRTFRQIAGDGREHRCSLPSARWAPGGGSRVTVGHVDVSGGPATPLSETQHGGRCCRTAAACVGPMNYRKSLCVATSRAWRARAALRRARRARRAQGRAAPGSESSTRAPAGPGVS